MSALGKLEFRDKGSGGKSQRDILNIKQKAIRSLAVSLDLSMSQCVTLFLDNIAEFNL